jgi:predicted nucleic acid-binding protein
VLAFDQDAVKTAVEINGKLKLKSKQIAIADLFIAATAISNSLPFATLNRKHFDRIDGLLIVG